MIYKGINYPSLFKMTAEIKGDILMSDNINNIIKQAVLDITENYKNEELFILKEGYAMPHRDTIIGIIKELRTVMFPGYFGNENIPTESAGYFVGHRLTAIYNTLKKQIEAAIFYGKERCCYDCIGLQAEEICNMFFSSLTHVQQMLLKDVQAGFDGDPAAKSKEDIIISYPGLFAIYVYRIAHVLYEQGVPFIPRIMTEYAHSRTGIDINAGATIGEYFFMDHGTGIVIGETTTIGNNVKIYQGVTIGALSTRMGQQLKGVKRHPTIENNVTIYSGSTILGGETVIGEGAIIGGNAFIVESVPAYAKVSIKAPELVFQEGRKKEKKEPSADWEI